MSQKIRIYEVLLWVHEMYTSERAILGTSA